MARPSWLLLALGAATWSSASACQLVLGDYRVDTSDLAPSGKRACQVDEYRCAAAVLEVCNRDRSGWVTFEDCIQPNLCNLNSASCRPCSPGKEYQCNGQYLLACTPDGEWMAAGGDGNCGTSALCSASQGRCLSEACSVVGKHRCNGADLERCAPGRETWQKVTTCAEGQCDAAVADDLALSGKPVTCLVTCDRATSSCGPVDCDSPGSLLCHPSDIQLQRCSETFTWTVVDDSCRSFNLCSVAEAKCDTPACATDERRCTGDTVEKCRGDRTGWDAVGHCGANQLCNPAAAAGAECETAPCLDGSFRCNSIFVEQCLSGRWQRHKKCPSACDIASSDCAPS